MSKPRLLDLFCGAGGAGMGYHLAGFEVVGVDDVAQPHYPFEFHLADAMTFDLAGFDVIHASPPCQGYSRMRHLPWLAGKTYPLLIDPTRQRLQASGVPWVIEKGIDWMPGKSLAQAIPPAYAFIGAQLMAHLDALETTA